MLTTTCNRINAPWESQNAHVFQGAPVTLLNAFRSIEPFPFARIAMLMFSTFVPGPVLHGAGT
ncbi:hypothetical protein B5P43_32750 [Bacillus sp. SRB_336]|nr:hypothetical protein B5P43_32750 [Bacillus sp. SRB_336]